ncbi:8352_t:CDS:2, partial [Ambispora gerdemannii]
NAHSTPPTIKKTYIAVPLLNPPCIATLFFPKSLFWFEQTPVLHCSTKREYRAEKEQVEEERIGCSVKNDHEFPLIVSPERWETRLAYVNGNRRAKREQYLRDNPTVLKNFALIWKITDQVKAIPVVAENMKAWSSVVEFMCEDLELPYLIIEEAR